jgi:drug/metabolite transporter (DMT)-like permease
MQGLLKSHLAILVVNLMYGANYVIAKGLMPDIIGPNGFILLRVSGAVILFWIVFGFNYQKIALQDFGRLAMCGLFGVAVNQLLFFNGLMLTSPINAPVIMTMTPILVLILSFFILKETPTRLKIIGVIIGATGSIIFTRLSTDNGFSSGFGDLLILLNASSYGLYLVLVKPLMTKYRPLTVITWVFTFGFAYVLIWPFSLTELTHVSFSTLEIETILRLGFVVICVTFLPYLLTVFAMKRLSPAVNATYIYLQPIFATLFIYLFWLAGLEDYTQDISIEKIFCALLVFAGVYLVIKPVKRIVPKN